MSDLERAWAAGFFDGEGSVALCTPRGRENTLREMQLRLHVGQVDRRPLARFVDVVGRGSVKGPRFADRRGNAQPRYDWTVIGLEAVEAVLEVLWPYLSEPKREQALAKIAIYREWRVRVEALLSPGPNRIPVGARASLIYQ